MWGVEASEEAVACAIDNAALNRIANVAFFAGDVGRSLEELHARSGDPDVVVVDPPRAGLSGRAVRHLGRLEAPRIVYVSCNPTTLAGNVKELVTEWGYTPRARPPGRTCSRIRHTSRRWRCYESAVGSSRWNGGAAATRWSDGCSALRIGLDHPDRLPRRSPRPLPRARRTWPADVGGPCRGSRDPRALCPEWLEQQAATGILDVEDAAAGPFERRLRASSGSRRGARSDERSLNFIAPFGRRSSGASACRRTARGVSHGRRRALRRLRRGPARGPSAVHATAVRAPARPASGCPPLRTVHDRLIADPPAHVADVACGCGGRASDGRAYPSVRVDGIDLDEASIDKARREPRRERDEESRHVPARDAADPGLAGTCTTSSRSSSRCTTCRVPSTCCGHCAGMLADGGSVSSATRSRGCLHRARRATTSACSTASASCTAYRWAWCGENPPGTARSCAWTPSPLRAEAGFGGFEILPIENDFYRFYQLLP